jgi:hypothetical protein
MDRTSFSTGDRVGPLVIATDHGDRDVMRNTRWRVAGVLTALIFAVILIATQDHYGETWDEWDHFEIGEEYYQYLFGTGRTPELYGHVYRQYYAPCSDIIAAIIKHTFADTLGWMSVELAWHLHLNLLFAASGLIVFLTVLPEYGGRAAYVCLVALFVSPHLLGHCHNNMKDFAVTAWTIVAVFAFHAGVRRRSYPRMVLAGLATGITLASKVNGVILGPIFLVYVLLLLVCGDERDEPLPARLRFTVLGCGIVHWTTAFGSMVLFWPWLWEAPLARFLETVSFFHHHIWNARVLYRGNIMTAANVPKDYAPYYVLITTPIVWLPFILGGLVRGSIEALRRRLLVALIGIAFLAPIIVKVLPSAPTYDGVRHFLPAFPFLACLVGFGLDWMFTLASRGRERAAAALVTVVALGSAAVADMRIHPYQSTFFNSLVGGGRGAMGRFELDYWGSSLKEAGRYVNAVAPVNSRVHVLLDLERLARLRPDLLLTEYDPDYAIVLNRESLKPDPYKSQTPIHTITADGAVLTKIYRLTPPR